MRYEKRHGSFYLIDERTTGHEEILLMADSIAILIDVQDGLLVKHGEPSKVRKRHARYVAAGLGHNIVLVESAEWDAKTLNRLIEVSGAAGQWLEAQASKFLPAA